MQRLLYSVLLTFCLSFVSLHAKTKIMPLGDSITWDWYYGDGRSDAYRHSYRNYLWYKLQDAGYDVDFVGSRTNGQAIRPAFDGDNEGYTGYTISQVRDLLPNKLRSIQPDIILLHIGTNDSVRHSPAMAIFHLGELLDRIDSYEQAYDKKVTVIIARIIPFPQKKSWVDTFNSDLDNMVSDRISNGDDIVKVNMNVINTLIDGIHPTDSGYRQMANIWYEALKKALVPDTAFLIPVYGMLLN